MEPQRPPHERFIRPPSYGGPPPHDPRNNNSAPPPPRPYGPPSSVPPGRSQPPFDPFRRAESETQQSRAPAPLPPFGYSMPQHHQKPLSPVPFPPPPHGETPGAYHSRQSSHDSMKQHSDGGVKDYNNMYREGSHDHPSSSHSYGNRQMLPPTSPPRYPPHGAPAPPPPPPPAPPSSMTPREPPLSGHRPGSSMSISSVLGSDSDRPPRDTGSASGYIRSSVPATSMSSGPSGPPSAGGAMSPPNMPPRQSSDYLPFQGSNASDKTPISKSQPPRQYRSSSGGIPQAQGPSESSRMGGPPPAQPFSHYGEKPTDRSPSTQYPESPYNQARRLSLNGPIQRPNSQPPPEEYPNPGGLFRPHSRPTQGLGDTHLNGGQRPESRYPDTQPQHRYSGSYPERQSQEAMNRDKGGPGPQDIGSKHHQPHPQSRFGSQFPERESEKPRMPWDSTPSQPASPESKRSSTAGPGANFGLNQSQDYNKPPGSQPGTSRPSAGLMPLARQGQPTPPNEGSFLNNALNKLHQQQRSLFSPTSAPSGAQQSFGSSTSADDQQRKGSDELLHHRNLLNINAENKRAGRLSPLPQAVQGAQAQPAGPTGEPGIKNELGRVFSGIGSGVGVSAPGQVGSGPSTPVTASPFKRDDAMVRSASGGINDGAIPKRAASGTGKRGRKPKDEESKDGSENGGTQRTSGARGGRRGRHVHHHHHHGHHHHHHRRKPEDEVNDSAQSRNALLSAPSFPRTSTPSDIAAGVSVAPAPHHHHHHHHHHHVPRTSSTVNSSLPPPPPPREHNKVVNLQPLLKSVAHLPRQHLGSTLYSPKIGMPAAGASHESAKFGYTSTPVPIPRFEGKENCTFTIRVPRFRIDRSHREEVCARRAIWGTGVYTDDSDPVAAAIHSGFIRGEWGEDVDISMLDLEIKEQYQHAPQAMGLNGTSTQQDGNDLKSEAKIPPVPPANKDLHITLLILPPLQRYDSAVLFGLRSRSWGANHDGMSFKVERIDWVDEGVAKGEERGGEARRKRLRSMMSSGRIATGAGMKGKSGIEIRQKKRAMGIGNSSSDDSAKAVETAS
ncbi:hypothetical protein FQN54_004168 [Arachnomyces sp. PD_36]|nr:hypothetical protein FQN54_004168 [Arachnomyces sp. PD_36]